jgi:hypothetical protein
MPHALIVLFSALSALAQMRMVAPLHEPIQYAQALPDGRMVVLTPQRLLLLGPAPEHEILAEFANQRQAQRSFSIHENVVYLPEAARQIHLLDLDDGLKPLPPIHLSISQFGSPTIANGQLYAIEGFRKLHTFSLQNPRRPERVSTLMLPQNGAAYRVTVLGGHAYMFARGRIYAVDVRNPQHPVLIGDGLELPVERAGAIFGRGDRIYAFTGRTLAVLDVSTPAAPTLVANLKDVPICDDIVPREDGVMAFRLETRMRIRPNADGAAIEKNVDEMPIAGSDGASLRAVRFWPALGFRGAIPIDDAHLCLLDGKAARVLDMSTLDAPKVVGETPFDVSYRPSFSLRNGIAYTQRAILDLRTPQSPARYPLRPTIGLSIDGDQLTTLRWKNIATWSLEDPLKPSLIRAFPYADRTRGITTRDGNNFIIPETGFRVIRLDGELREIGRHDFTPKDRPTALVWDGDDLIASMYRDGIYRFDVSDPRQFKVTQHFRARRVDQPVAVDGVVFAVVMSRGLVAVDMRESATRRIIEHGPMVTGDGSLLRMGDHLVVGQPNSGATLYHSPLLAQLREEAASRQTFADRLDATPADLPVLQELAALCVEQGQWRMAARYFDRVRELGGDRAPADALARKRAGKTQGADEFAAAIARGTFGVDRNQDNEISLLRVHQSAALHAHLGAIYALPALAYVDLSAATDKVDLDAIQSLRLTGLRFHGKGMQAADFESLARFTELYRLDLSDSSFSDAAMVHLDGMSKLRDLDLRDSQVTGVGVAALRARFFGAEIHFRTVQQQEQERPSQPAGILPSSYRFELADNHLLLLHPDDRKELSRVHPGEAFDAPDLQLTAIAPQETLCWVGTDAGLMRFDPGTQVWSRFAIDRTQLEVLVDALNIADGKLTVHFAAKSAIFDLATRTWLAQSTAPVAESVTNLPPSTGGFPLAVVIVTVLMLVLASWLILRT